MNKLHLFLLVFIINHGLVYGQNDFVNQSITLAFQQNLSLQQKVLQLQQSEVKLSGLRAKKLPTLNFQARYSRAFGGRTFDIPVGELLNPVFQNLNLLNQQFDPTGGIFPDYPMVNNEVLPFLREREQDTHVRLTLPILNPVLNQGKALQQQVVNMEAQNLALSKQELSYEVKKTYFNYLKIKGLQKVMENAAQLVEANLKTTKSLHQHHKVTLDNVYLAEAEVKSIAKELALITQKEATAKAYFNTLLNQPYTTPIPMATQLMMPIANMMSLEEALETAKENRAEMRKMDLAKSMTDQQLQAEKATYLPQLNLVGQYGIQGVNYGVGADDDYAIGSLVLSWTIFAGDKKHKLEATKINQTKIAQQKEMLQNKLELEVIDAFYALATAKENQALVEAQAESATKAYQLIHKKFEQGQANLIEITNARTKLTNAEEAITLATYDYWLQMIAFEKAIGK